MKTLDIGAAGDPGFLAKVSHLAGTSVGACYACGKCSAGCPLSYEMDYQPHQIIRLVQLGLRDEALRSSTIWLCASCITCTTRCPCEVDVAGVMDMLRSEARRTGVRPAQPKVAAFYQSFLGLVRSGGRLHELGMTVVYKLRSRDLFTDIDMGGRMLVRGKLKPLPPRIRGRQHIAAIFRRVQEIEQREDGVQ